MPVFQPLTSPPAEGTKVEGETLDAKVTLNATASGRFALAKDVAAFANRYGRSILVGAREEAGCIRYDPQPKERIAEIHTAFSEAVRDRCSPRPVVEYAHFDVAGGSMLAVNVAPFVGQPIGVHVKGDTKDGYGDPAHVFPIRVGKDASYLLPEQLPMYSDPKVRRNVLMLARIPNGSSVRVVRGTNSHVDRAYIGFDEEQNVVKFDNHVRVPLDLVRSVSASAGTMWLIITEPY